MNIKFTLLVFLVYIALNVIVVLLHRFFTERNYKRFVEKEKLRLIKSIQVIIESL